MEVSTFLLLTVRLILELQYRRTAPLARVSCCGTEHEFWDGSCRILGLFKELLYWHSKCVDVWFIPPPLPQFLKPSLVCALLCLALYFFFMQCQHQHCTSAHRKELCPCACKTHHCTSWDEVLPQMFPTGVVRCEQVWRQTAAQLGFVGCPKSGSLVFLLNGRGCPAWDSCNVFYDWGDASMKHCIQKLQVFSGLCILMVMQSSCDLLVTWQWYHRAYRAIHSWPPLSTLKEFLS